MAIYFAKRIASIVTGFIIFSLLLFFIGQLTVNDSVLLQQFNIEDRGTHTTLASNWKLIRAEKQKRNLHLPPFYFSLHRSSSSDTLYRIEDDKIAKTLSSLSYFNGSWESTQLYFQLIKKELFSNEISKQEQQVLLLLLQKSTPKAHASFLTTEVKALFPAIFYKGKELTEKEATWFSRFNFRLAWNGSNNRYHRWMTGLLRGKLGRSYSNNEAVSSKINTGLFWTVFFSISSIVFALLIATPLALLSTYPKFKKASSFFEGLFFVFYAIPSFWMATLLILFLASGSYFLIFPVYGLGYVSDEASFFELVQLRIPHLILPLFCLTYGSIAYLYKQMKEALKSEMNKDYVITAFSKGLSFRRVVVKHVFRNASFPIITILGGLLPVLISGSFIVENIFSIPGMGKLTLDAFFQRDFPTIFSVLMISYVLTALGLFLADIFYQLNDPRINFQQNDQ